ncbi:alginate export family protein [Candidatus Reidiella endopervernicosa]|uniref:Alginate export family protein n=1 Tax=Candidatus Reidiella endopervernicosa TaxID=2738883 RepID=A0A6N0HXL0_9GAMM|nr:alginate export family protein [Candidatus Reidiella endopervernicosa]QKQ27103.1 alginate export family protein [Candidatus Reidiella endopervernicosa]
MIKILRRYAVVLILAATAVAAEPRELSSHHFYSDFKLSGFSDMAPLGDERYEASEGLVRLGIRYNRLMWEDWLLDADLRAIFSCRELFGSNEIDCGLSAEIKRLYLRGENLFESPFLAADIGRTRLRDQRSWLFDDDIDLIKGYYDSTLLDIGLGAARWVWNPRLDDIFDEDDNSRNDDSDSYYLFGAIEYQWHHRHFMRLQLIHESYEAPERFTFDELYESNALSENSELNWLVISFEGEKRYNTGRRFNYWLDLATVQGDRNLRIEDPVTHLVSWVDQSISGGFGLDLGLITRLSEQGHAIGVRYALGQGDPTLSGDYSGYLQPHIASNKDRRVGDTRLRYYGDTLDPALGNLQIVSVFAGLPLNESVWLEGAYYHYQQMEADSWLQAGRTRLRPNGLSTDIGYGLDLTLGGDLHRDIRLR